MKLTGVALALLATGIAGPAFAEPEVPTAESNTLLGPGGRYLTNDAGSGDSGRLVEVFDPLQRRTRGASIFFRDWLTVPGDRGPLAGPDYDRSSCAQCHVETRPVTPRSETAPPPLIARPATAEQRRLYGRQISTAHHTSGAPEGVVRIDYLETEFIYFDGERRRLRKPVGRIVHGNRESSPVILRAAPLLFGWGLLERVDVSMLTHFDAANDRGGKGVSGRLARLDGETAGIAVLGWKSSHQSLRSQIAAALADDMGVVSAHACNAECDVEIEAAELDALTEYVRYLGVPDRRPQWDRRGQDLFGLSGCSDCHVPVLMTSPGGPAELSAQVIWPYSDLMLHDMGAALTDPGDHENAREWRTAPLWGLGIVERRLPQRGFLHDGRAATIEEAVLWHDGEAAASRQRFTSLDKSDRKALLAYVRSL